MKKLYYIRYKDRYGNDKQTTIKAKNEIDAECKFYKKDSYSLIVKIALI